MRASVQGFPRTVGLCLVASVVIGCGQQVVQPSEEPVADRTVRGGGPRLQIYTTYREAYEYYRKVITEESAVAVLADLEKELEAELEALQ